MPTKVLVFENDPLFAQEVESRLRALDCDVTVVDDPNVGLQLASVDKPDLILLAIELPKMNGFSVCNRLKREAELAAVPVLITSTDATEATFEQHRRLPRTRADDYVKKPIGFDDLLEHIRRLVPLGSASAPQNVITEDDIIIDDEVDLPPDSGGQPPLVRESQTPSSDRIDADVDDLTEHVFDSLLDAVEDDSDLRHEVPPLPPPPGSEEVPADSEAIPLMRPSTSPPAAGTLPRGEDKRLSELTIALSTANDRLQQLEIEARQAESYRAEVAKLRHELEETQAKNAAAGKAGGGGPTAREFLDLRERLNRKDKELLDMHEKMTQKEKELLGLRESSLGLEREKADLADKLEELEPVLAEARRLQDIALADKEAANKRAEDAKRRMERVASQLEERQAEVQQLQEEKVRLVEEHQQVLQDAAQERKQAVTEAQDAARALRDQLLAEAHSAAEHHERESVEAARREAYESAAAEAANREAELRRQLEAERNVALEKARQEHEQVQMQQNARVGELDTALVAVRRELEEVRSSLTERSEHANSLEREIEGLRSALSSTESNLADQRRRVEYAENKWREDQANLDRIKDALAAALVQVEAVEGRSVTPPEGG